MTIDNMETPEDILGKFEDLFGSGFEQMATIKPDTQPEFNQEEYFRSNTLENWFLLSEDDLITVSTKNKNDDGYTAKFVRLGDIVKFIGSRIGK